MNLFKLIFEEFPEAILVADTENGKIEYVNKEAEILFSTTREKLLGLHQSDLHPPEKRELYKKIFAVDSENPKNFPKKRLSIYKHKTLYIQRFTGEKIPVYINSNTFEYKNREYIIGLFIPERKTKKHSTLYEILILLLRESEELFHQGSFFLDIRQKSIKNNPYILVSNKTKQLLGIKRNLTRFHELSKLVIEEQKEIFESNFYNIIDNIINKNKELLESVYQNEYILQIQNQFRYFFFDYITFSDRYLVCLIKDITEQKQKEELLLKREKFLKILSEARKVFFYSLDEVTIFKEICKILVLEGNFPLSFVGIKKADPKKSIEIQSYYYKDEKFKEFIESYSASWSEESVFSKLPESIACREGKYSLLNDVYFNNINYDLSKYSIHYSIESYISLPIIIEKKVLGVLNIYSEFPGAFQKEEVDFLVELSETISHALLFLRERKNRIRLLEQNIQFHSILENSTLGFLIVGLDGKIIYTNRRFEEMSGYLFDEIVDQNINILKSGLHEPEFYQEIWNTLRNKKEWRGEIVNKRKDGSLFLSRSFIFPSLNIKGEITHFVQIVEDLTLEKYYEEMIEKTKNVDATTNLPNRNSFLEKLNFLIRMNEVFYLVYVDIYHFSKISQLHGYTVAEQLLILFSQSLNEFIQQQKNPEYYFVARIGDDEFAILIRNQFIEEAITFTENLLHFLKKDFNIDNQKFILNVSAGIAIYPENAKTADEMLRISELALNRAVEEKGVGNYSLISGTYESHIREKIQIETALQEIVLSLESKDETSVNKTGLSIVYQPICDIATGKIHSLEALLRWQHPQLGNIPPTKFIPIAEQNNYLIVIGEYVIEKVLQQLQYWKENHYKLIPISINISYIQLKYTRFIKNLYLLLDQYQIDPSLIEFEITENSFLRDEMLISNVLEEIKKIGIKLLIDDFGTGYSSLSYLLKFNFDYIKIDKFFIDKLLEGNRQKSQALSLIRSIVNLAQNFNMKVIAEGIEKPQQKEILLEEKVPLGQGFLFNKPLPNYEIEKFLV